MWRAWLVEDGDWLAVLAVVSFVAFVASALAAPIFVVRIPADYFAHDERPRRITARRGIVRGALVVGKNLLGALLLLAGLTMLVLPGQGLLTLLAGLFLLDFPGKYRFEQWLVARPGVLRAVNWLRLRRGRPPLRVGPPTPVAKA